MPEPGDWLCKCGTYSPRTATHCTGCGAERGTRRPLARSSSIVPSLIVLGIVALGIVALAIAVLVGLTGTN